MGFITLGPSGLILGWLTDLFERGCGCWEFWEFKTKGRLREKRNGFDGESEKVRGKKEGGVN